MDSGRAWCCDEHIQPLVPVLVLQAKEIKAEASSMRQVIAMIASIVYVNILCEFNLSYEHTDETKNNNQLFQMPFLLPLSMCVVCSPWAPKWVQQQTLVHSSPCVWERARQLG